MFVRAPSIAILCRPLRCMRSPVPPNHVQLPTTHLLRSRASVPFSTRQFSSLIPPPGTHTQRDTPVKASFTHPERINDQIHAAHVTLVDDNGSSLGVYQMAEALAMAKAEKLDLIEVGPLAKPPVCRIMSYSKFKYLKEKREHEIKKAGRSVKLKELRISERIDSHDLDLKMKQARAFLGKGHPVKIVLKTTAAREDMFRTIHEQLHDVCHVDAKQFTQNNFAIFQPVSKPKPAATTVARAIAHAEKPLEQSITAPPKKQPAPSVETPPTGVAV